MPRPIAEDFTLTGKDAQVHAVLSDAMQYRRVIVVGDVHGCLDQLQKLLKKINHTPETDVVILAGNLVNKGPQSVELLQFVRNHGFRAVLGNHELAILGYRQARDLTRKRLQKTESSDSSNFLSGDEEMDDEGIIKSRSLPFPKAAWVDNLSAADLDFVQSLPYTLSLPLHNAIIVHAGLIPMVPLAKQIKVHMICLRNLLKDEEEPIKATAPKPQLRSVFRGYERNVEGSVPWASEWRGPAHVYFGHDAGRGLQQEAYATGLDTGCVKGGKLTAAILKIGQKDTILNVGGLPKKKKGEQRFDIDHTFTDDQCSAMLEQVLLGLGIAVIFAALAYTYLIPQAAPIV